MRVDRSLKVIAAALAIWSFTTLVGTGQLPLIPVAVCYLAYAAAIGRRDLWARLGDGVWMVANLVVAALATGYAFRDLGTSLVYSTVYFQIQLLLRYPTPRGFMWLFLVSLFQVVLAAAITVDLIFLLTLLPFMLLATLGMALLTLERIRHEVMRNVARSAGVGQPLAALERPAGEREAARVGARVEPGVLPGEYLSKTAAVLLAVICVSVFFFLAIPRLAVRKVFMRLRPFDVENLTGFSDEVLLGGLSDLRRDKTLVMRVWPRSGYGQMSAHGGALRLRGMALDAFDGARWTLSAQAQKDWELIGALSPQNKWTFDLPFDFAHGEQPTKMSVEVDLRQTDRWLFGPSFVARLGFVQPADLLHNKRVEGFRASRAPHDSEFTYDVWSYEVPPIAKIHWLAEQEERATTSPASTARSESLGSWAMPAQQREEYTRLPAALRSDHRIIQLVAQLTEGATSALDRVSRFTRYFHTQFGYSLTVGGPQGMGFIPYFLFVEREGHCEAFATAMAVLCRSAGIPARIVTGFYTIEYNRIERFFYVRQCDAHTWVEVWLDGFGWAPFDPTPPSALDDPFGAFSFVTVLRDYWDTWSMRWRSHVVDYNISDQLQFLYSARRWMRASRARGPFINSWFHPRGQGRSGTTGIRVLSILWILVLLALGAWLIGRGSWRRNGARGADRRWAPGICPVGFYGEILAALARRGWERRPAQTPAEFAHAVVDSQPLLADFRAVTQAYYRVRFSGDALRPAERSLAQSLLAQIRQ